MGSLMEVLEKRLIGRRERVKIGGDIAGAVAHMHNVGLVHRDLKSLNVFIQGKQIPPGPHHGTSVRVLACGSIVGQGVVSDPTCLLGDFGETTTIEQALNEEPRIAGTLQWMAPEIIE